MANFFFRRMPGLRSLLRMRDDISAIRASVEELTSSRGDLHSLYRLEMLDRINDVEWAHRRITLETHALMVANSKRYDDPKRLNRFEAQVFSQNGEDGIITEIFSRLGTANRVFVEIGCGDGRENNTAYRLLLGWSGYWIDGDERNISVARREQGTAISQGRLSVQQAFVTRENAGVLLQAYGVPREFDLLSIDVDRNSSWVWRALEHYTPRVVVVEYNASIPPQDDWEIEYDANATWDGTLLFGASLRALQRIGSEMGYSLVGCDSSGVNAFFVRDDLTGHLFSEPFDANHHYEPPRYFLVRTWGHPRPGQQEV
jgi:hypothetical protein